MKIAAKDLEIILLVEDTVNRSGLLAEHGLSFWINYGGESFIYDTGQGMVIKHNADQMELDFTRVSAVFLSHGHYDHSGGLAEILTAVPEMKVYAHERVFNDKFAEKNGNLTETGIRINAGEIPGYTPLNGLNKIRDGLTVVNGVKRTNDFEPVFQGFKVKSGNELRVDDFAEEISLLIETVKGPVLVTGCSHLGIVNILEHIRQKTMIREFYAVIGGFHLVNAAEGRIQRTVEYLQSINLEYLIPIHCTGFNAVREMVNRLQGKIKILHTGDRLNIRG